MSASHRVEGDQVYCHVCSHQWHRAQGGLQCPACESEFVEIIDTSRPPPVPPHPQSEPLESPRSPHSPRSPSLLHEHNPWAPDPDEDDITTLEFNTGRGGRGMVSFSSRTYTFGGGGGMRTQRDFATDELGHNLHAMLGNIMGFDPRQQTSMPGQPFGYVSSRNDRQFAQDHPPDLFSILFQGVGQPRTPNQVPSAFDLIGAMFNPIHGQHGDAVFSQDAFDRVMTQLMEQNTSNAPGPASDTAIASLQKKPMDKEMMGTDGTAECSICMDNLELGDEVTVLPCKHWFHGECVISWLKEHDTCPHCRKPITNAEPSEQSSRSSRRRRHSRRSSSVASPDQHTDSPSSVRDARQRYYGSTRPSDFSSGRPPQDRRSSDRSHHSNDNTNNNGAGAGVGGWLRSRLPFSGQ